MAGSNYYYASGLIAGQLLDISRFPQDFILLGLNLLKSWNNKQLLKEAVQDFVETVAAANPLTRIYSPPRGKVTDPQPPQGVQLGNQEENCQIV